MARVATYVTYVLICSCPLYPFYDLGKHNSLVTLATSTRTTAHNGKASNTLVIHIRDWGHYKACHINV
jgi:hypothetical protein